MPLFNVREAPFFARGDGQADDYPAIARALEAAETAGGGTVRVPAGTYVLRSGHLQFSSTHRGAHHITLEGDGASVSTIVLGGPFAACIYEAAEGLSDVTLRDLTFDAGGIPKCEALTFYYSVKRLLLERCIFRHCLGRRAVTIGNTSDYTLHRVQSEGVRVIGCRVEDTINGRLEAFILVNCRAGLIRDCTFDGYTGSAAALAIYGYNHDIVVENNSFLNTNGGKDIYVQQSSKVVLKKNRHRHRDTTYAAVWIVNSADITVEVNVVDGSAGLEARGSSGVFISDFNEPDFDGNPTMFADSHTIIIRRNVFRNVLTGVDLPWAETGGENNRNQSDVTIADNTFTGGGVYPAILVGGVTAQNIHHVRITRNRFESLPAIIAIKAGLIAITGNPGFAPTALAEPIKADRKGQAAALESTSGISKGQLIDVDTAANLETIEPLGLDAAHITAIFKKDHEAGARIAPSSRIAPNGGVSDVVVEKNIVDVGAGQARSYAAVHVDIVKGVRVIGNDMRGTGRAIGAPIWLTRGATLGETRDNRADGNLFRRD